MEPKTMNMEEYKSYITSNVAFMEIWKSCYIALLSNPSFTDIRNDQEKLDRAWKEAEVLKRGLRQYMERISR